MKYCFLFIVLSLILAISCAKIEQKDEQPPVISNVRLNINDTIVYNDKVIKINDSINDNPDRIDTLVIGKRILLKAQFADDKELSTYVTRLDSVAQNIGVDGDTIFKFIKLGTNIFAERKIEVRRQIIQIPDSLVSRDELGNPKNKPIREGDYIFSVICLDMAGNKDSIGYKVKLLTRKTIYDSRQ